MTRINLIPAEELYDQHLLAEYREIQHIPRALQRSLKKKAGFSKYEIPVNFTLNTGHIKFFYDKGLYLTKRFDSLRNELLLRRFNLSEKKFPSELFPRDFFNDWIPLPKDLQLIRERIASKVLLKKDWYRLRSKEEL